MKRSTFWILLLFFSFQVSIDAQQKSNHWGVLGEVTVVGHQLADGLDYRPTLIGAIYQIPITSFENKWTLSFEFVPLFGVAFADKEYFEFGLNGRAGIYYNAFKKGSIFFKISSGPHWINVKSQRQADGFIFADYFIFGFRKTFNDKAAELYVSYRHLSDLSFKQPNAGINNLIIGLAYYL